MAPPRAVNKRTRRETQTTANQPPPPIPVNPQPSYQRFVTEAAQERFAKIKGFDYIGERRFDFLSLTSSYPTFESTFRRRGWENLNNFITEKPNLSIILEFFANAYVKHNSVYEAVVRGKIVDFSATTINQVLGLPVPQECAVERRRNINNWPKEQEDWDALLDGLMREGKSWVRSAANRNPQRINVADLMPIPKAWAFFILATIVNTSCNSEMITNRAFILLSLLDEHDEINVGALMARNLKDMVTSKNRTLGHGCLINLLCARAGVPVETADVDASSQGPINETTMLMYEASHKKYMRKLAEQGGVPPPEERAAPHMEQGEGSSQQQPLSRQDAYYLGTANWMKDVSARMYVDPPYFVPEFEADMERYRQNPRGSFQRFEGSEDHMNAYFQQQRDLAAQRERDIRENFEKERNDQAASFAHHFSDVPPEFFGN